MSMKHSPLPWSEVTYNNDTGPSDEGLWEWYAIPDVGKFDREGDAEMAREAVNATYGSNINPRGIQKMRDTLLWIRAQTCGCNALAVQTRIEEALAAIKGEGVG